MARTKGNDLSKKRDEAIAEAQAIIDETQAIIDETQAILDEAEEREKKQKEEQEARVLKMILYQWKEFAIKKLLEYFESCDNGNDSFTKYKCSHYYCTQEGFHIDDDFYDKFRRRYRAYQRDEITRRQLLQEAFDEFPQPSAPTATPTSNIPQEWPTLNTNKTVEEFIRIHKALSSGDKPFIVDDCVGFLRAFGLDPSGPGRIVWTRLSSKKKTAPRMILEFVGLMNGKEDVDVICGPTNLNAINKIFQYKYTVKDGENEKEIIEKLNINKDNDIISRYRSSFIGKGKNKHTEYYNELCSIVKGK